MSVACSCCCLHLSMIFLTPRKITSARIDRFTAVAMPMAQGLAFTAIRSGTGIGFEVNCSGGSWGGKKMSRMLLVEIGPDGLLLQRLAKGDVELVDRPEAAAAWDSVSGYVSRSFAMVVAGSVVPWLPGFASQLGAFLHPGTLFHYAATAPALVSVPF